MLRRRDDSSTLNTKGAVKLKGIGASLLTHIKAFAPNTPKNGVKVAEITERYIARLRDADSVHSLNELEGAIGQLLSVYVELEQVEEAQKLEVLQKMARSSARGLVELSDDTKDFANQLKLQFSELKTILSKESIEKLRERLQGEMPGLFQLVSDREKRQEELTGRLKKRMQKLEDELAQAKEALVFDALTAVYNRRAFDERLHDDFMRFKLSGEPFALLMFDIDHFKNINDNHGHLVGDKVLAALADTAKTAFRPDDFVARYGGEEFAVVLYNSGTFYASRAAERFRLLVRNKVFEYERANSTHQLRLTVSLGASEVRADDTVELLLSRADRALYLAKKSGRNQVKTEEDLQDEELLEEDSREA